MTSLFDKDRHQELTSLSWSAKDARDEIARILDDIEQAELPAGGWPLHPLDAESYRTDGTKWALYAGAAGVVVATEILRKAGCCDLDLRDRLSSIHQNFLKHPDVGIAEKGLQIGEIGILVPAIIANPADDQLKSRALECMHAILDHPAYEVTSGQTGMMYGALALYRATGKTCWKNAYLKGAETLWSAWQEASDGNSWLWDNDIFGQTRSYLGACHGVAGNLDVLVKAADLLPGDRLKIAIERSARTLTCHALRDNGMVNWFASAPPETGRLMVQWCHGAAGIVTAFGTTPRSDTQASKTIDMLLDEAATLVWRAGPLAKGAGICHGTAGNGYAFLAMYLRDRQPHWLDKARAFAAHAIQQAQEHRCHYGQTRFSLMTGDAGLAVYLHHCLNPADTGLPGIDLFG